MQSNFNEESLKKGEQFEKYVEEVIFPEAHYELLHKTSDSKQNTRRYVSKSLEPDFQFKCRLSGKEFYVEAKWRAKPFRNQFDVLSDNQWKTFPGLHSEDKPVFIVFGYGGIASNPDYVHLIPLKDLNSSKIPTTNIGQYQIPKAFYPNNNFHDPHETEMNIKDYGDKNHKKVVETNKSQNYKVLGLAAVGLIAILLSIYSFAFSGSETTASPEERLHQIIDNYYQDMNGNQIEKLPEYLSSDIDSWYGTKDMSTDQIVKNAKKHRGTYPYSATDIDWDSFKVIQKDDGNYLVSYDMIYKSKKNIEDDYKIFNLHMITTWDKNFKMKSIREIRN